MSQVNFCFPKWHVCLNVLKNLRNVFKGAHKRTRIKMIDMNASSEAILRNNFALGFRIYKKKSLEKPRFCRKRSVFVLASNATISMLLAFSVI